VVCRSQPVAEPLVTARPMERNLDRPVVKPSLWTFDLSPSPRLIRKSKRGPVL
jgi:hypothetical protein